MEIFYWESIGLRRPEKRHASRMQVLTDEEAPARCGLWEYQAMKALESVRRTSEIR
jgi:hypothetical protein